MNPKQKNTSMPLRSASWVEPLHFDEKTVKNLEKWLTLDQLEALRARAEFAISAIRADQSEPTLVNQKNVLSKAVELASDLALILERAPGIASAKFSLVFQKNFGDALKKRATAKNLRKFADGVRDVLSTMPEQGHRKSPVYLVSEVAEVLNSAGIKTSVAENSRFFKICRIVFEATGIYQSPAAPIRVFMGNVTG